MKNIAKFTTLGLLAAALLAVPSLSRAQDAATNAPAMAPMDGMSTNTPPAHKKKAGGTPIRGKIAALDASAGTLTIGKQVLTVTSTTKITTNGVPATLADFKVGDTVTGYYKKAADGTETLSTLRMGGPKKKKAPAAAE